MINDLKKLCRQIISNYTIFVRNEIHKGRTEYKETGIDEDLTVYRNLFLELLSLSLGLQDKSPTINKVVKDETIFLIRKDLSCRRYKNLVSLNKSLIYGTCSLIFDKVVSEILGGDLIASK